MSNFQLEFRQNNEIFNNWNFNWLNTSSSGFLIELHVHDHRNGELRTTYMTDFKENRDFLSERGMREFLSRILWPEETSVNSTRFFPENGVQLFNHSTPGFQFPISLDHLVHSVLEIVWSIRSNPRNRHLTVVPIQLNLVIYQVRQFQFLDDSFIFDGVESFNGRLMQQSDDSLILQSVEVVGLSKTKPAIQRLKEEKAEGSTDCSICLESVGVGEIVARMPCSHLFHTRCITRWLHKKPSCPLCRAPAC
ncbi:hypothetical protein Q3G72_015452 [Acer saccharum]|nr:hypothetical protein Q3G72_015452 [Acer saccharum]